MPRGEEKAGDYDFWPWEWELGYADLEGRAVIVFIWYDPSCGFRSLAFDNGTLWLQKWWKPCGLPPEGKQNHLAI